MIQHNKKRIEKDLFTHLPGDEKITLHACQDDNEEPLYIASLVKAHHNQGVAYSDMAVLYRSNYSSRAFERRLKEASIPYVIYGGIRFYERQEIKDALSYLKLCSYPDPDDPQQFSLDLAVLRVINQPRRGIGAKSIEQLTQEGRDRHINLLDVMRDPQTLSSATEKKCRKFVELIDNIRAKREAYSLEDYLDYILNETGYIQMLESDHEDQRLENLKELQQDIAQTLIENPDCTLESYLQDISLFTDKVSEGNTDSLLLMTVHTAKGLEFDTVYLVNFNDGVFPSARSVSEGGQSALEEERRLCYVAMTRAKKHLVISYNYGFSYLLDGPKVPSRFIKEIPKEFIRDDTKPAYQPAKKAEPVIQSTPTNRPSAKLRKGDLVIHKVYGEGVVLKVEGRVGTIAFNRKVGIKKLNVLHPSLKKA